MDLKARAKQLKTDLPAVFLALKRKETPWTAKALAALTIGYALSPIDLIPDFIPVLGYLDDLILLPALVALTIRLIPAEVLASCRAEAEGALEGRKAQALVLCDSHRAVLAVDSVSGRSRNPAKTNKVSA